MSLTQFLLALACILCLYILIAGCLYWRKLAPFSRGLHQSISRTLATTTPVAGPAAEAAACEQLLPPLIERPQNTEFDVPESATPDEEPPYELLEMEEISLLKEAERVVEEIQDTVDHIASSPANPEEIFTKIRAIVSRFSFFMETEYYDAINSFIAVTVQRDCDVTLSVDDLKGLWYSQAA